MGIADNDVLCYGKNICRKDLVIDGRIVEFFLKKIELYWVDSSGDQRKPLVNRLT
jgi:hypothetical protein